MIKKRQFKFELFLCGVVEVIGAIIAAPGLIILVFGNSISEYIYECKRKHDELVCDKAIGHLERNCKDILITYFRSIRSENGIIYTIFVKEYNFTHIHVVGADYTFSELSHYIMADKLKELYQKYDHD